MIGSAQRRTGGVFLQHGSILAGPRHLELPRFLKHGAKGNDIDPAGLALVTTDLQQELGRSLSASDLDSLRLAHRFKHGPGDGLGETTSRNF